MNILSLRYFLKIAEHSSITRAAAELHITQPALTRHAAQLEHELGVKLLMRHGRGVRLTDPGRLLCERARTILEGIDQLSNELLARQSEPHGTLSVGLPFSFSEHITVPVVEEFRKRHPDVELTVIADSSETLEALLMEHAIDFGILSLVEDDPEIVSRTIVNDQIYLVGARQSDIRHMASISLFDAAALPVIRPYNATVVAKRTDLRLAKSGRTQNVAVRTSASLMLELADLGLGYVMMPGCALPCRGYDLAQVPIEDVTITWTASTLRTRPPSAAVRAFEEILGNVISARAATGEWPDCRLIEGAF